MERLNGGMKMNNSEIFAVLEKSISCEWDVTEIEEGILKINFYVDEVEDEDE